MEKVKYTKDKYIGKNTRERIEIMIDELNLGFKLSKVFIMTNLRNFGYIFNPVSFYYCFNEAGQLRAMFSEVNNTFHDQKMFYINTSVILDGAEKRSGIQFKNTNKQVFRSRQSKNFYISPFTDLKNVLHWEFDIPGETMFMNINSVKEGEIELMTKMSGRKRKITDLSLLFLLFRYPLYTLMVIVRIHWQALKLWRKKVPFNKKDESDIKIVENIKGNL
jgi:DUF1365 family protein